MKATRVFGEAVIERDLSSVVIVPRASGGLRAALLASFVVEQHGSIVACHLGSSLGRDRKRCLRRLGLEEELVAI